MRNTFVISHVYTVVVIVHEKTVVSIFVSIQNNAPDVLCVFVVVHTPASHTVIAVATASPFRNDIWQYQSYVHIGDACYLKFNFCRLAHTQHHGLYDPPHTAHDTRQRKY